MLESLSGAGNTGIKINMFQLWGHKVINSFNKFKSSHGKHQTGHLYYSPEFLYSGSEMVSCMYVIDAYPEQIPVDMESYVRAIITGLMTKVNFCYDLSPYQTNWSSAKTKSTISTWKSSDSDVKNEDNAYEYHDNSTSINNKHRHQLSLFYMNEAHQRGLASFKIRVMITITGVRGRDYDNDVKAIYKYLHKDLGIRITRIQDFLPEYAGYFSPASVSTSKLVDKNVGYSVLTDEILARFSGYQQGQTAGSGMICLGLDVLSGYPVFTDFKRKTTDANNFVIVAETNGGKSYFTKNALLYLCADDRFILTINDIEGGEYDHLEDFIKTDNPIHSSNGINLSKQVIIDLSEGSGKYYDPLAIVSVGGALDNDAYNNAVMYTKGIFTIMSGNQSGELGKWIDTIISDSIGKAYYTRGVTSDPSTWNNSIGMTLRDVYIQIENLYLSDNSKYKDNEIYRNARDLLFASVSPYFTGVKQNAIKYPITLSEIIDSKIVICSFGMKGRSNLNEEQDTQLGLAQLYASAMSHLRSIYAGSKQVYNVKVWEEFQRWGAMKGSEGIIRTALTGGRKLGDVNIVITNNVGPLLNEDKFGVFESTTSYAISAVNNTQVRHKLADVLGIPQMKPDLDLIAASANLDDNQDSQKSELHDIKGSADFEHAFLVKTGSDTVISKVFLPKDISSSKLFYTSPIDIKDKKVENKTSYLDIDTLIKQANEELR
jgi:hypothetical protein